MRTNNHRLHHSSKFGVLRCVYFVSCTKTLSCSVRVPITKENPSIQSSLNVVREHCYPIVVRKRPYPIVVRERHYRKTRQCFPTHGGTLYSEAHVSHCHSLCYFFSILVDFLNCIFQNLTLSRRLVGFVKIGFQHRNPFCQF